MIMRRIRRKFQKPKAPWDSISIKEERIILSEFGLRKKRELRTAEEKLRGFRRRARELIAIKDDEKEKILVEKLLKLGILAKDKTGLDDVLGLTIKDILERRLQTIVFRKGIAKTAKEARQFIVHGRVSIDGRRTPFPSYIVSLGDETKIKVAG